MAKTIRKNAAAVPQMPVQAEETAPLAIGLEGDAPSPSADTDMSASSQTDGGDAGIDTSKADAFLRGLSAQQPKEEETEDYGYHVPVFRKSDAADGGTMQYLHDMYGDTEADKKATRAHQARLAIMGIGDAFRHLGNIYHASKGAPAQKLSASVPAEDVRYQKKALAEQERRRKQAEFSYKVAKERADRADKDRNYQLAYDKAVNDAVSKRNSEYRARREDARKEAARAEASKLFGEKYRKAKSDAERAAVQAKWEEQNQQDKHARTQASIHHMKVSEAQGAQRIAQGWERIKIAKQNANNRGKGRRNGKSGGKGGSSYGTLSVGGVINGKLTANSKMTKADWEELYDIAEEEGLLGSDAAALTITKGGKKGAIQEILRNGGDDAVGIIDLMCDDYGWDYDAGEEGLDLDDVYIRGVYRSFTNTRNPPKKKKK